MSNKTYNNIISLLGFIATLGFVVCKIIGLIDKSWWFILVPFVLVIVFRNVDDEDDNSDNDFNDNNFKMA